MGQLIEFILRNPLVALVLLGAVFQVLGKMLNKAGSGAANRRRAPSPPPSPGARPRQGRPSEADIAAEMRRILGMEPQAPAPVHRPQAPLRRDVAMPEKPPEPLRMQTMGNLGKKIEPHVGERMGQRRAPISGAVGAQQLGSLGGRVTARSRGLRTGAHLVDLSNLPRAIVLREIFDKPLGLRGFD